MLYIINTPYARIERLRVDAAILMAKQELYSIIKGYAGLDTKAAHTATDEMRERCKAFQNDPSMSGIRVQYHDKFVTLDRRPSHQAAN